MKYRTAVMYMEIGCFVICLLGWALVCSTLPTEYWNISTLDQGVLTTANFFSNLWKDCVSDSTGVSDCKEFPSLLALELNIHMCRALVIMAIILSFFGAVLSLVGMKCTKIGGSDVANARVTFAAGINYMVAGFCAMIAYSWYGNKIRKEFVNPNFKAAKFELGAALFVGWGGSSLLIIGGFILSFFAKKEGLRCRYGDAHREPEAPAVSSWSKTHPELCAFLSPHSCALQIHPPAGAHALHTSSNAEDHYNITATQRGVRGQKDQGHHDPQQSPH